MDNIIAYQVIDTQTKAVIKEYGVSDFSKACKYKDKKDNAYGAVRYVVKPIRG